MIPMNNLSEPHMESSSMTIGVSGESKNAPYGPKACSYEDLMSLKSWGNTTHERGESGWAVGKTDEGIEKQGFIKYPKG